MKIRLSEKDIIQINHSGLFDGCDFKELSHWMTETSIFVTDHKTGEYLMRRNSKLHEIGILLRGSAVVERQSADGLMHMSRLKSGDIFGVASILGEEQSYVIDIRCVKPCRTVRIKEDGFLKLLQHNPRVLQNYLRYLNQRIRFLNNRLDALSKNTVPSKLLCYLTSVSTDGAVSVRSYTELAASLCFSRATLYRALDTLCAEGKILREGKQIILLEEA